MPGPSAPPARAPRHRASARRARRRWVVAAALLALGAAVLGRVFVIPPSDEPRPTDLIVVLGGLGTTSRTERAAEVSSAHPGATVLYVVGQLEYCPDRPAGAVEVVCTLPPPPGTTRGEARFATAYARDHGMSSITVVTTADQVLRARFRFARCWDGDLVSVQAPASWWDVLSQLPYQSAAMVKALVVEPGC